MDPQSLQKMQELQATLLRCEQEKAAAEAGIERLLQTLPVDKNLLFFYGDGCSFTKRVQPEIRCLEASLGKRLTRLETWDNESNAKKYAEVGGPQLCGGVPFFFNASTENSVCGAHSCEELKRWATATDKLKPRE